MSFDRNNDLLMAHGEDGGTRNITRTNLISGVQTVVADNSLGNPFVSPNDLTVDAAGCIYFTDARYIGEGPLRLPIAVYRVDADGTVTQIVVDIYLYVAAYNLGISGAGLVAHPNGPSVDQSAALGNLPAVNL